VSKLAPLNEFTGWIAKRWRSFGPKNAFFRSKSIWCCAIQQSISINWDRDPLNKFTGWIARR